MENRKTETTSFCSSMNHFTSTVISRFVICSLSQDQFLGKIHTCLFKSEADALSKSHRLSNRSVQNLIFILEYPVQSCPFKFFTAEFPNISLVAERLTEVKRKIGAG